MEVRAFSNYIVMQAPDHVRAEKNSSKSSKKAYTRVAVQNSGVLSPWAL